MNDSFQVGVRILEGRSLLMSASVPSPERDQQYLRRGDVHLDIAEAVVSLTRTVLHEGGRLVYGGHPAVSRLMAQVAGSYIPPRFAEEAPSGSRKAEERKPRPPITVYQSRAFEGHVPDDTWLLAQLGFAEIEWVDAVRGERFDPELPPHKPQCLASLKRMRSRMLKEPRPVAMVCIGGMEGVEREFDQFREIHPDLPVYVLATTGGAAALIAEKASEDKRAVRVIDQEILDRVRELWSQIRRDQERPRHEDTEPLEGELEEPWVRYRPYALIMQLIVHDLGDQPRDTLEQTR